MKENQGLRIHINGIVQGVGFRPFVYSLAAQHQLMGWVRNTSAGVDIEVEGPPRALDQFFNDLQALAPPLSKIDTISRESCPPNGFQDFRIIQSKPVKNAFQPISPDVSVCDDCLRELFDPADHRWRYPFINCTNCGPRFTIIKDIPYDRPQTTMAPFPMCAVCGSEYQDPIDRRFHAQPVACPDCGPHIWLEDRQGPSANKHSREIALTEAISRLEKGQIMAVKGLGGFHLACNAADPRAVNLLRERKHRPHKPLAVMMPSLDVVKLHCRVSPTEEELLISRQRPIVLLERKAESNLALELAPNQNTLGVMLPYTPLHYLLFAPDPETGRAPEYDSLVMTSGNRGGEPIVIHNQDAVEKLSHLVDSFLFHNRDIYIPCDDSVTRVYNEETSPIRRSRGYVPYPLILPGEGISLFAAGAELKNTFCLTRGSYAFLSQHIGDLQNYETLRAYQESVSHFKSLFRVEPEAVVYDCHPDYLSTRFAKDYAQKTGLPAVGVQHHHAHIASCLAENEIKDNRPVIGIALDGTGYGDDGAIWGGEFLLANTSSYQRPYHLAYFPLPGGDSAIKEPWRIALAALYEFHLPWEDHLAPVIHARQLKHSTPGIDILQVLLNQLDHNVNTIPTSSMGRLFDAVSSLLGIQQVITYEGQAAIEMEAAAHPHEAAWYNFEVKNHVVDPAPLLRAVLQDLMEGTAVELIAARFHNSLANMIREVCLILRKDSHIQEVALSGGVWQNMTLLKKTLHFLEKEGFTVYTHQRVPANDGGIALGQAAVGQKYFQ